MLFVGNKNHRNIGNFNCLRDGQNFQAGFLGDGFGLGTRIKTDNDIDAALLKVERVSVSLTSESDYSDGLAVQNVKINIGIVIRFSHNTTSIKNYW